MMLRESMVVGFVLVMCYLQQSSAEECRDLLVDCYGFRYWCDPPDPDYQNDQLRDETRERCPMTCGLCEDAPTEDTCPTTRTEVPEDPSNVCLDFTLDDLCTNQKITFTGKTCPSADRITIWFFVAEYPQANPQFDARFGYGGKYRYQANNRMASGYGARQTFDKAMELRPNQDFVMEFVVRSETSIEWMIDGSSIGTYKLREQGKVADIHKVCLVNCAIISSVELSPA